MKIHHIPFYFTALASLFMPYLAASVNSKAITYIPELLLLLTYALYLSVGPRSALSLGKNDYIILGLITVHVVICILTGRGIGSGGILIVIVTTILYAKFLGTGDFDKLGKTLFQQISLLYILHVVFIIFEMLSRIAGYTDVFLDIAGHATEVTKYKNYNSATLLWYLGVEGITGMNSLLLGSQTASQLVLFSMVWFLPFYSRINIHDNKKRIWFWFAISALLFPFVASMTAVAIFLLFIFMLIYVVPNSRFNNKWFWWLIPIAMVVFFKPLYSIIAFRLNKPEDINIYIDAFSTAPAFYLQLPFADKLIGVGRDVSTVYSNGGDFGMAMLLIQVGIYLFGVASIWVLHILYSVLKGAGNAIKNGMNDDLWVWLGVVNALLALGWATSLLHYTPAIELGGRQMFALHLAVCVVFIRKSRNTSQYNVLGAT